jgi:hypothetical protein
MWVSPLGKFVFFILTGVLIALEFTELALILLHHSKAWKAYG